MILSKIKETAYINSGHVFGVARDDGIDARKCTLNSGPGVMNKSNRVHAPIQEFLSGGGGGGGGGGVEARRPGNSLDNVFYSHQLILQFTEWIQWLYYRF